MRVIGIDPGKWALGVAAGRYEGEGHTPTLVYAAASIVRDRREGSRDARLAVHRANVAHLRQSAHLVAVEEMEVQSGRTKRAADLLDLQATAAALAEYMRAPGGSIIWLPVRSWKGGESKRINHARTIEGLDDEENKRLTRAIADCTPKKHRAEILDAVGIMRAGPGLARSGYGYA